MSADPTKYRVTLVCKCAADFAEGYGETVEEADACALRWFLKNHKRSDVADRIVEHAVQHQGGGWHYEEIET